MKTNYEIRYAAHPEDAKHYDTARLRRDFLVEKVFAADEVNMVYSMYDRMIVGGAMVFIWKYLVAPRGGALAIYELLPAFLCACLAIVVVSLLTPAPERKIVETYDAYNSAS